ncbi:unnamed protein product [Merluccius merluccius]
MSRNEKTLGELTRREGCLLCKQSCHGYQQHLWRKVCGGCGCRLADHAPGSDTEDDQRMGRLLADSPCSHLTTKVKGGGGLRVYKRNRMIVTNPDATRKDPTFQTTSYTWCPAGVSQTLALQYMSLLPEGGGAVWGEEGSLARRRRLQEQLPPHDVDPMLCQGLLSDQEISSMLLFVRSYKQEVLGVGEVAFAGEGGALMEAANQRSAKEAKDQGSTDTMAEETKRMCAGCGEGVTSESPAVFAERAGYHRKLWHPACFCCSECGQGLVDLVYFWSNHKLFCGRHFCQTKWPRCSGCDELIFCPSFRTASDGQTFHLQHYCCWRCGTDLDTPCSWALALEPVEMDFLPEQQHVICVDMPGHEGSSRTGPEDYSIQGQVHRIHQFVQAVGLDRQPFHLVGSSMGGNVAGVYAAQHPKLLAGLTLICPAGLVVPRDTGFVRLLKEMKERGELRPQDVPLIPSNSQQMEDMLRLCCHNNVSLPRQILKGLLASRLPNNDFYSQVLLEITSEQSVSSLQDNLHLITAPLLVIWGKDDQVIDMSGASVLQEAHPTCQVALLEHCGHAVMLDRPRKAAQLLTDFLSAQEVHSSTKKHS